jgi:uncharacterized membrane protein
MDIQKKFEEQVNKIEISSEQRGVLRDYRLFFQDKRIIDLQLPYEVCNEMDTMFPHEWSVKTVHLVCQILLGNCPILSETSSGKKYKENLYNLASYIDAEIAKIKDTLSRQQQTAKTIKI